MSFKIKRAAEWCAAFALAFALAGCSLLPKEEEALAPPLVKPANENYQTETAVKGTISIEVNGSGYFESDHTDMAQFTGQGGRVQEVLVHSGDTVKKGDVLVQLVMEDLDLQVKQQELTLEQAKYNLRKERAVQGNDEEVIRMAALQVEIEQLKFDRLTAQYNSKQLKANMDGQVIFVEDLHPGDYVDTYQTLVIVADTKKLRLTLNTDGMLAAREVNVGFPAEISLKVDGEKKTIEGKVVQTPSSAPQTLNKELAERYAKTLYIQVDDVPKGVEIGAMADVKITTQMKENVVKIPRSGLRNSLGRTFVRTLEEGSKVRELDVEAGLTSSTEVEIVHGLDEGDVVILQ
ncbi:efflux RND transporter periplasmic adaptor subunit [Cohnella lubricantis]|uniref:Biotin/lipoyl-binding protein n=1 Tax=Cohnella lubricantis TaxID=2163172 RepID=A0A841TER6_9BACL|nr:efflux RND transporter periplasmic adaptor subunit [Cohnella lubricantis]MBB6676961.1 biotin/lipoyl-binding protein [Cohnella lubricantis]MBP2118366.1 macrolide-specific efflux system membrane fusion protein [Cohnella lubricantis]